MNSTMKWSMAAAMAILIGIFAAVAITTKPDEQTTANEVVLDEPAEEIPQGTLTDFDPITEPVNELKIIEQEPGGGLAAEKGDEIVANYTGAYAVNGEIFDSSNGNPFTAILISPDESADGSGLISGWVQGMEGMREGEKRRLIIPGELAYGEAPEGYEPGSTGRPLGTLVFDVELVSVNKQQ